MEFYDHRKPARASCGAGTRFACERLDKPGAGIDAQLERRFRRDVVSLAGINELQLLAPDRRSERVDRDILFGERTIEWHHLLLAGERLKFRRHERLFRHMEFHDHRKPARASCGAGTRFACEWIDERADLFHAELERFLGRNIVSFAAFDQLHVLHAGSGSKRTHIDFLRRERIG